MSALIVLLFLNPPEPGLEGDKGNVWAGSFFPFSSRKKLISSSKYI